MICTTISNMTFDMVGASHISGKEGTNLFATVEFRSDAISPTTITTLTTAPATSSAITTTTTATTTITSLTTTATLTTPTTLSTQQHYQHQHIIQTKNFQYRRLLHQHQLCNNHYHHSISILLEK